VFSSCTYELLPLWEINVESEGGRRVRLEQRYQPPLAGSGPANLIHGEAWLPEGSIVQGDYWKLVYSAEHHNWNEKFWVLFDEPLGDIYGLAVYEMSIFGGTDRMEYLDEKLDPFQTFTLKSYEKHRVLDVYINEFMAINSTSYADEQGDFDPWIEIHNVRDSTVELSGLYLTNVLANNLKWQFPADIFLAPKEFLIVWADGEPEEGPLHTNFILDSAGGEIGLFDLLWIGGGLLDSIQYGPQATDISRGRLPDGTGEIFTLGANSPGEPNLTPRWILGDTSGDEEINHQDLFLFSRWWQDTGNEINYLNNPVGGQEIDGEDLLWLIQYWK